MKTLQEVVAEFPQEIQDRFDFSEAKYTGALAPITGIKCSKHGVFRQYAAQFRKNGATCPQCGAEQRAVSLRETPEAFVARARAVHGDKYDYADAGFVKYNATVQIRCRVHGVFSITANRHVYRKQGCGQCEVENRRERIVQYRHLSAASKVANTAVDFFDRCREAHAGAYTYPEQEYCGAKEKIRVVCPTHGEFTQAAWAHLSGKGCMQCGASDPQWERDVAQVLLGLGHTVVRSAPVLEGKHIDLYLPERRFGVELHGLHWHTEKKRGKQYHREKWELAEKAGIRLVQVFEDEWLQKSEIVKARLHAFLGVGPRHDARKMTVRVLDTAVARAFLERTHIQGGGVASMYYGLCDGDTVVACASFGKSRSGAMTGAQEEGVWEVVRYASVGRVRGGFGRLLAWFLEDAQPRRVISYCDLRYGDGKLYQATGFTLHSITEPDYWWVPAGKQLRIPRYNTQKHKLAKHPVLGKFYAKNKSENQVCAEAGWEKIYGVGSQKWVLDLSSEECYKPSNPEFPVR